MKTFNTRSNVFRTVALACMVLVVLAESTFAAVYYWDTNSTASGAGGPTPSGNWNTTDTNWNTNANGTGSVVAWDNTATPSHDALFSAGTDATGNFMVTVSGTQIFRSITVEEGNVTITGGTAIQFRPSTYVQGFTVVANSTLTINTPITVTPPGDGALGFIYKLLPGTLVSSVPEVPRVIVYDGTWDLGSDLATAERRWVLQGNNAGQLGVLQGHGNFSRPLGTGTNNIEWFGTNSSGGFAARGGQLNVNITSPLSWAVGNFVGNGHMLVFGSATADNVVNFQTAINLNGAARSIHVVDNVNSNNDHAMLSGQLTGNASSGITKVGNGTLVLSNSNNTYEGATTVSSGTLLVNGTNSGNGNVSVATSATLGGSGSLGTSSINVSGILSPGNSIESLSGGALTMIGGSTFEFEALNSSSTGADLMVVNGVLSLTDVTLDLSGANLEANTWSFNDRLTLISYAGPSITSGFVGYDNDGIYTFGTNQWQIKYDNSMKGNNFIGEATGSNFVTLTLVPEPSSLAMLAFGAIALWLFRRKQG